MLKVTFANSKSAFSTWKSQNYNPAILLLFWLLLIINLVINGSHFFSKSTKWTPDFICFAKKKHHWPFVTNWSNSLISVENLHTNRLTLWKNYLCTLLMSLVLNASFDIILIGQGSSRVEKMGLKSVLNLHFYSCASIQTRYHKTTTQASGLKNERIILLKT